MENHEVGLKQSLKAKVVNTLSDSKNLKDRQSFLPNTVTLSNDVPQSIKMELMEINKAKTEEIKAQNFEKAKFLRNREIEIMSKYKLSEEFISNLNSPELERMPIDDAFFGKLFKGAGFKFDSAIFELIDNSLGAGCTKINIKTELIGDNVYNISIEDNGCGIPPSKIKDVLTLGPKREYKSNSISYYGVGMKFALAVLSQEGFTKITSTNEGQESTIYVDCTEVPMVKKPTFSKTSNPNGTIITIPNVHITSNKITALRKSLGACYFPHVDNGNELEITLQHNSETTKVSFTDPLYRNIKNGIDCNDDEVYINGLRIGIKGRLFRGDFNEADLNLWDGNIPFSTSKSGVYFRLNGRYITFGEGRFYGSSDLKSGGNRIRIEVEIDKDLLPLFGNFNKSKITISDLGTGETETLKPFIDKLTEIANWGARIYKMNLKGPTQSDLPKEAQDERTELNRDLNARRKKLNNDSLINAPVSEDTDKDDDLPKGTKKRPKIGKYDKKEESSKDVLDIRYQPLNNGKSFDYWRESLKLVLCYNTNHDFYPKYQRLPTESKKLIDQYTIALCDAFNIHANHANVDRETYDCIINDLLIHFSSKLLQYVKD